MTAERSLEITYVDLATIKAADRNPKLHDLPTIRASLTRFGIADVAGIVNDRTGKLVAGHGRVAALRDMRDTGDPAPAGVHVTPDGSWTVPVLTGISFATEAEAEAFLLAHNRTTELGGWDYEALDLMIPDLDLDGTGYEIAEDNDDGIGNDGDAGEDSPYSAGAEVPTYEPTMPTPPPIEAIVNTAKRDELLREIEAADLDPEVEAFLRDAAHRHTRFHYGNAAEYYAHAPAEVQALMEASALVIIDIGQAIERGYTALQSTMSEIMREDREA